jgi:hypothetical protein
LATVTVTITGRSDIERLVESFEGAFHPFDRTSTFASFVDSYQEPDGGRETFRPTDPASGPGKMAQLEARGSLTSQIEQFFGLAPGSLPRDSDDSVPAFGSALRVRTEVQPGDEISFDWMFDARDYTAAPPDGFADNDYAVVAITEGASTQLFKLSDVRQVGDQGASGWRSSVYTAASAGTLVIGFGVLNDRTPSPIAENSFLLVDNVRVNREFDDSYQVVQSQGQGALDTLVQVTT